MVGWLVLGDVEELLMFRSFSWFLDILFLVLSIVYSKELGFDLLVVDWIVVFEMCLLDFFGLLLTLLHLE